MKMVQKFLAIIFMCMLPLLLSCGGGGGGGGDGGGTNATITGTVAGTVVVAIDENNNEVDRVTATGAGSPKSFTLTVPVGGTYRFYLIENEGTANEEVFFIYQDSTNVFNISSAVTIDLGFVDTSSGVAVPANNPLNVSGVTSGGQDTSLPPGVNDNTTPTTPAGLSATAVSSSQINLSWTASKDNVGVSGYKIYRDGTYLKSDTSTSTSDTGLSPETQYCYTVSAYDAAGNESSQSSQACATTNQGGTTYNIAEYFPLGQGDTWTFRGEIDGYIDYDTVTISGTETINSVVAAKKVEEDDGDYILFTSDSNGFKMYKQYDINDGEWKQFVYDPPINFLPGVVSVGTSQNFNSIVYYTDSEGNSETGTISGNMVVEGVEDVTITAGTFKDCLKVKLTYNITSSDGSYSETHEETSWLAKEVGTVKATGTDTEIDDGEVDTYTWSDELVSATVGGVQYPQ